MFVEVLLGDFGGVWELIEIGLVLFFEFVIGFGMFRGGFVDIIGGLWIWELWFSGKNGGE